MQKRSNLVFKILFIIAWIIFIGLCIEAGALLVNFIFSVYNPETIPNLYQKLDLTEIYAHNRLTFFGIYLLILFIAVLKACLFYLVIRLMHQFDLSRPFNRFVSRQIVHISSCTFFIGILSYLGIQYTASLQEYDPITYNLAPFWSDSEAFILMSAVIYIIATIFKRGIEIQQENELTI